MSECESRRDLAAACHLFHQFGWDEYLLAHQHLSIRLPSSNEDEDSRSISFLINPPGLPLEYVTAADLDRVDATLLDSAVDTSYAHADSIDFHLQTHGRLACSPSARDVVRCVFQCQTIPGIAVAGLSCGILPLCQGSYFALEGGCVTWAVTNPNCPLDATHKVVLSPLHGLVTAGRTPAEAFHYMFYLTQACSMQVAASAAGRARLGVPSAHVDAIFASTMTPFQTKGMGHDLFHALLRRVPPHVLQLG
ncbi:Aste57867_25101 [Aphanomyces stellatus]|uniref:Aste57867_25101 protein n=1 Tax=Aphanomyces stellatus TaxID=120398 RepID=A0A485LSY3_9STRA|nr:hypothetical protein As57867_025023 [Aphanomyces stellatus]VFU01732.1 Aste57867_25101 [Aphanomyces stellatus]